MADVKTNILIARPFTEVFKTVTDFDELYRRQEWQDGLTAVNVTSGNPLRAGSIISIRRRFMGGEVFINGDVLDFQRNKRFELRGVYGRFPFSRVIEFQPSGRETAITDRITLHISWLYFWLSPFYMRALKSQTERDWQQLKALLEG